MTQQLLDTSMVKLFGIDTLPADEQGFFLEEIGKTVLELTLVRLCSVLGDSEVRALTDYADTTPETDVLLKHIFEHYPQAEMILKDVVEEIKSDAMEVLK
jgi:hypothetical protein